MMTETTTRRSVAAWIDDAHYALTEWAEGRAPSLSVDTLRALAATPHRPIRSPSDRHTYWTEAYTSMMKEQLRDGVPIDGGADTVDAWRARQDARQSAMDDLLEAHAECLLAAAPLVVDAGRGEGADTPRRRPKKRRRTSADAYLATVGGEP
jgi:hypothetical protein